MNARRQRGQEIAAQNRIRKTAKGYVVPCQSGQGKYAVTGVPAKMEDDIPRCTCPDYETRGVKCKHIIAVEYVVEREHHADGSTTVTETVRVTATVRRTYAQDWRAYNAAQTTEGDLFPSLLRDLCRGVAEPTQERGRPRATLADSVFCATLKGYSTLSTRRFMSDLSAAKEHGLIAKAPHHSSVFRFLENPALTPILRDLIVKSSLPPKSVEIDLRLTHPASPRRAFTAVSITSTASSGRSMIRSRFTSWSASKRTWLRQLKLLARMPPDTKQLPALVAATAKNFAMAEVSADKGYASGHNIETVKNVGAGPFIAFRTSDTGRTGGAWAKALGYFMYRREEFPAHYQKRSNVETACSMMKRGGLATSCGARPTWRW